MAQVLGSEETLVQAGLGNGGKLMLMASAAAPTQVDLPGCLACPKTKACSHCMLASFPCWRFPELCIKSSVIHSLHRAKQQRGMRSSSSRSVHLSAAKSWSAKPLQSAM